MALCRLVVGWAFWIWTMLYMHMIWMYLNHVSWIKGRSICNSFTHPYIQNCLYLFGLNIQKLATNQYTFGNRLVSFADIMIYATTCPRYTNIVRRSSAVGFCALTTDSSASSVPLKSYLHQRSLQMCDVKVFLVETEAMAWYMGVFGATSEQCSNANQQKHLCIVACQHKSSGKFHAASQIICNSFIYLYI